MKRSCWLIALVASFFLASCKKNGIFEYGDQSFHFTDDSTRKLAGLFGKTGTVLFLLAPDCPLCVSYTSEINRIKNKYRNAGVEVVLVFPGNFYSKQEIVAYLKDYSLQQPALLDHNLSLTKSIGGTVTPQAFLYDKQGNLRYKGAIDDWAIELGRKRREANNHFLDDAIFAMIQGREIKIKQTQSVGCFIEK